MSLASIALVNRETKIVDHVVIISKDNYEKNLADLVEHHSDYDCVDTEGYEDPKGIFSIVNIGFSYDGKKFVSYETTQNEISAEDLEKSRLMLEKDIAMGLRPDLDSKPADAPGPKEDNN